LFSRPMAEARIAPTPMKRIPADQLQKSVQRLHGVPRANPKLEPITPRKVLTKEAQEAAVNRLYHETTVRRKAQLEALERKRPDFQRMPQRLPRLVTDAATARLHDETMERRKADKEKLQGRFLAEKLISRKNDMESQRSANSRLYDSAVAQRKERREALEAKLLGPLPSLRLNTYKQVATKPQ